MKLAKKLMACENLFIVKSRLPQ